MYKNILKFIKCPNCSEKLRLKDEIYSLDEIVEGTLYCGNSHSWRIQEGVINFESQEQDIGNNWSELYEKTDYEELDTKIKDMTADNLLKAYEIGKREIISIIEELKPKTILDIATGRGMLLTELAPHIQDNTELICVDLSYNVLKYDRIKIKKLNPSLKVSFIACDATSLPFESNSVDLSVSFIGIQNMLDIMPLGIKEANRVSKQGLTNIGIVVRNDSKKLEQSRVILEENGIFKAHLFLTEEGFKKIHDENSSNSCSMRIVYEGVGKENKTDLIPFESEWFGLAIARCI